MVPGTYSLTLEIQNYPKLLPLNWFCFENGSKVRILLQQTRLVVFLF